VHRLRRLPVALADEQLDGFQADVEVGDADWDTVLAVLSLPAGPRAGSLGRPAHRLAATASLDPLSHPLFHDVVVRHRFEGSHDAADTASAR
jgi:hypothetical protein